MKKRLSMLSILAVYYLFLINLLVFKIKLFRIGRLRFSITDTGTAGQINLLPFKTILPYLLGQKGWLVTLLNLGGNIALFIPIGFLAPFVFPKITWQKALALALAATLIIEVMQLVFRLGIFDVDDIILNALGVMIGYWIFRAISKKQSS